MAQRVKILLEEKNLSHHERLAKALDRYNEMDSTTREAKIADVIRESQLSRAKVKTVKHQDNNAWIEKLNKISKGEKIVILKDLSSAVKNKIIESQYVAFKPSENTLEKLAKIETSVKDGTLENLSQNFNDQELNEAILECVKFITVYDIAHNLYNNNLSSFIATELLYDSGEEQTLIELSELSTAVALGLKEKDSHLKELNDQSISDIAAFSLEASLISAEATRNRWSWEKFDSIMNNLLTAAFMTLIAGLLAPTGFAALFFGFIIMNELLSAVSTAYFATFPAGFFETKLGVKLCDAVHAAKSHLGKFVTWLMEGITSLIARIYLFVLKAVNSVKEKSKNAKEKIRDRVDELELVNA